MIKITQKTAKKCKNNITDQQQKQKYISEKYKNHQSATKKNNKPTINLEAINRMFYLQHTYISTLATIVAAAFKRFQMWH